MSKRKSEFQEMLECLIDQKKREIATMEHRISAPTNREFRQGLKSRKAELPKMKAALAAYKKAGGK